MEGGMEREEWGCREEWGGKEGGMGREVGMGKREWGGGGLATNNWTMLEK
jgi:hypothetical protein